MKIKQYFIIALFLLSSLILPACSKKITLIQPHTIISTEIKQPKQKTFINKKLDFQRFQTQKIAPQSQELKIITPQIKKEQKITPIVQKPLSTKTISKQQKKNENNIRVLLEKYDATPRSFFSISSQDGMYLYSPDNPEKRGLYPHKNVTIALEKGKIYIQGEQGSYHPIKHNRITFAPREKYLSYNGRAYQGIITLAVENGHGLFINQLNLDDYVCAVLLSESLQGWPDKMQQIQAIITRTYALYQIQQTEQLFKNKTQRLYDLKNNNCHQTYTGVHSYTNLHRAVAATTGIILKHRNKLICAMFDACCGGVIPAEIREPAASLRVAPYLARHQACNYCNKYKLYRWEYKISLKKLLEKILGHQELKSKVEKIGNLTDLVIHKKDKAGVIEKVKLIGKRNNHTMTARYLKTCLGTVLKSYAFSTKLDGNHVIISGKGHGHHLGVCQHGARELIQRGWSLKKIFEFYYPGSKFSQIK